MLTKIKALLMAIYLFFMCIPYGNSPIDIKMTDPTLEVWNGESYVVYELKDGMEPIEAAAKTIDVGPIHFQTTPFSFSAKYKNVGRPFKGHEPFHPAVSLYKVKNGKYSAIFIDQIYEPCEPTDVLIKNGEILDVYEEFSIPQNYSEPVEPGVYSLEINVYGCKTVFEDVVIIK